MDNMADIKKALELPKLDYYETHLSLINCLLPKHGIGILDQKEISLRLIPMEIKLLASFIMLEGVTDEYRFSPQAKKTIMKQLGLSPAGLSNYLRSLTNKGYLIEVDGSLRIWNKLQADKEQQLYMFKLINQN